MLAFAVLLPLCGADAAAASATATPPAAAVAFTVSLPAPHTHLLEVEMRVHGGGGGEQTDLVLPVWTPGDYKIRDFARNVQAFAAFDAAGRPLSWRKADKTTWRVRTGGARRAWRATYRVYSNDRTASMVDTGRVGERYAFWNNTTALMHVRGRLRTPATLRIAAPPGWKIATGLPAVPGSPDTFRARDFDHLYDCPVLVGEFRTHAFAVRGVPHRIAVAGSGSYDAQKLTDDVGKIVEASARLMGDMPYADYTFLLLLAPSVDGGRGLEHANSAAIVFAPDSLSGDAYAASLPLIAHEFFHLWNVKRIRPEGLGPFDYTRENYSRVLWVAEGFTEYYQNLILRRAGLLPLPRYLAGLTSQIQSLRYTPGIRRMSVEQASLDAWLVPDANDENWYNAFSDYYTKGSILGLLLDLEIRRRTAGARSLDDVMRVLYAEYGKRGRNYRPEDVQRVCERFAGVSLADFFRRYVRGTEDLDYGPLSAVGLMVGGGAAGPDGRPVLRTYLGIQAKDDRGGLIVDAVYDGAPAQRGGLNAGDRVLAIGRALVTAGNWRDQLAARRPGEIVRFTVERDGELRTFDITLGGRPPHPVAPVANPTPEQKRLFEGWLGAPFPKPEEGASTP